MKKLQKRLLSLSLALVMAFALLPANTPAVYATATDGEIPAGLDDGDTPTGNETDDDTDPATDGEIPAGLDDGGTPTGDETDGGDPATDGDDPASLDDGDTPTDDENDPDPQTNDETLSETLDGTAFGSIAFGTRYESAITAGNAQDQYTVVLTEPGRLTVSLSGVADGAAYVNMQWYDSANSIINNYGSANIRYAYGSDTYTRTSSMDLEPGTYYVYISQNSSYTGSYTLRADFTPANYTKFRPNNEKSTADRIVPWEMVTGYISYQDNTDWYAIELAEPGLLSVSVYNGGAISADYVNMHWFVSYSEAAINNYGSASIYSSDAARSSSMYLEAGIYYVRISKNYDNTGTYRLRASFTPASNNESEPNDTMAQAKSLMFGQQVTGFISYQDNSDDYYSFNLPEPGAMTVIIANGAVAGADGVNMYWYDSLGEMVNNYGHAGIYSTRASSMDLEAGTYYVKIGQYYGSCGTYSLLAFFTPANNNEKEPNNDRNTIPTQAQTLISGERVKGYISYQDDIDLYRCELTSDGTLSVSFSSESTYGVGDVKMQWYDDNGVIVYNNNDLYGTRTVSQSLTAGIYYIGVSKYSNATGTYNLTATFPGATDPSSYYTVAYNQNYDYTSNGFGVSATQIKTQGTPLVLSDIRPTRSNYTFMGWATSGTNTIAQYQLGSLYTYDTDVTLYAVWKAVPTYTVTYNANVGLGAPTPQTKTHGAALTISNTRPTRTGYNFIGWAENSAAGAIEEYQPGASYTGNRDITLYAVWHATAPSYTITYDANGGTGAPEPQTKTHGNDLILSRVRPTHPSGYAFIGWSPYSVNAHWWYVPGDTRSFDEDRTLYAVWDNPVSVDGITLNKTSATLNVSDTELLQAAVSPAGAANKAVTWSSSAPTVAFVDQYGLVTGISAGAATITATTADGSYTANCSVTVGQVTAPAITTAALADGVLNTAYNQTLVATGSAPITWSIISGSLPGGLTLNSATGGLSGTPTATGTFNFTVAVANSAGSDAKAFSITVSATAIAPTIVTAALPGGTVGTAYSQTLAATGTGPITWGVSGGNLPNGLSLGAASGMITGTPSAAGTFSFTVVAVNSAGNSSKELSITIGAAAAAPAITTNALPACYIGTAYSQTLAATGTAPITWSVASGSLPGGLSLDSASGTIAGTAATAGTFNFTVAAANSAGSASKALSITVAAEATSGLMKVTVTNGTGGGNYEVGTVVTITANTYQGQQFTEWSISPSVTFTGGTSKSSRAAQFVMPGQPVTATANYEYNPNIIVQSTSHPDAYIDLTAETYTLPRGFYATHYSLDGGRTWKKGTLPPAGTKFSNLLNKRTQIWLTNQLVKKVPVGETVKFPTISARPKANSEKLGAYYLTNTWALRTKTGARNPGLTYEYALTNSKNKPLSEWMSYYGSMAIQNYGTAKTSYLFRTPATAYGQNYTPASKAFKVTPANYSKAPKYKINYKKWTLKISKGYSYMVAGRTYRLAKAYTLNVSAYPGGTEITVWKTETGKKPRSETQTLTVPY